MGNYVSSNSCTTTDPQGQIEQGSSSTSTALRCQMEVGVSSISCARQDKRDPQNPLHGITPQASYHTSDLVGLRVLLDKRVPENPFDEITPKASSSSRPVMKKGSWDVFINHRGCDTKVKIASAIYHTLDLFNIRAFLDNEEFDLGDPIPEEIKEAMKTAQLHIAIFSENYARSPWCLAELSYMLKTGTPILPVFYHVQPDDLRWVRKRKGCYAPAFSQHKEKGRYSSRMLDEWQAALETVSNLSGHVLNSINGDEGMLLKTIVNSALKVVKREPLEVAKHPVGMDEIVGDFERSQKKCFESEQQVKIVGIVGYGGSGKTTLARELYNRKSSSFERSSILDDVRDAASKTALYTKQKKLLADLRIQTESFDSVTEGQRILRKSLTSLRVLIVLDDVDHLDQVDALLPSKESLGSGSLIIVTTREGDVLENWGITSIYKMQPLHCFHAKKLFCWHAFLQDHPPIGFEDLVEKYRDVCSGLPLSLKVIGAQLYGKSSKDYWVSQLERIQRILPREILQRLRVSYDALDEEEKEIFLDIACFFIGERKSSAIALWDSGLYSWEMLYNKCLVEVDEKECIRMHDHLRDLGREIAKKHSPSRIWSQRQSMDIQQGMPVRGINVNINPYLNDTPLKEYMEMIRMSNVRVGLQILSVRQNDLTQECGDVFRDLLWLRWYTFKHRCIPSWLSLENIRVLEFIDPENLEALWEDANPPLQLRELLIGGADKLQNPSSMGRTVLPPFHGVDMLQIPRSIGHLIHLKRLSIDSQTLSGLPEEFCGLNSLEHLDLSKCWGLSSLPNHFGDLVNLRYLNFKYCYRLGTLPVSFKQLTQLEHLDLCYCSQLTLESDILENITSLKHFAFSRCSKLQVLPRGITNQASLRSLKFFDMKSLRELPASIGQLSKLEELIIKFCPLLTRLPTSLGNLSSLATLTLEFCESLESLPIEVRQLCSLQTLSVVACPKVYEMPSLAGLVSLENLNVSDCPEIKKIEGLAGLVSLENLDVSDCPEIKKIEGLEHLTSLEKLVVSTDWMAPGINSLRGMERLRMVKLKANYISAFEACIQSIEIEKWPSKMTICGPIYGGIFYRVMSILTSFTFPGLAVADSLEQVSPYQWCLTCEKTDLSNAAVVCFLVRCEERMFPPVFPDNIMLRNGEWIVISVFTDVTALIKDGGRSLQASLENYDQTLLPFGGRLMVGERGSVVECFKQLFQTLCQVTSMS